MTLKFSRGLSIVLLVAYVIFAHFQTRSQSSPPPPPPQDLERSPIDSEDDSSQTIQMEDIRSTHKKLSKSAAAPEKEFRMNKVVSLSTLLISAGIVSVCAEFMVESIEHVIADAPLTEAFLGLIILPLLGNVAELATAVAVANKQKIDLAINVVVGSSIQITTFMAPVIVLLSWFMDRELSLYFDMFQTVTLFATTLIVIIMLLSGRTHYLLGVLLCICYVVIGSVF
jgi:Ca2+:H+ antiporter